MEQRVVKTGVDDGGNRSSGSRLAPAQNRCFFSQIVDGSISREHLAEVGWGGQCVNGYYSSITHDPLLSGFRGRA